MVSLPVQLSSILLLSAAFISGVPDLSITPIIQNLSYNEYYNQPSVIFAYKVSLKSLKEYIDPRFNVSSPYNNDSAYIILQINNDTAYFNGATSYHGATFSYLQAITIYTIVEFNNTLYRETLATSFNFTPPAIVGNLYQDPPYGSSLMYPGLEFSANNETGDYHFSSSSIIVFSAELNQTATINVTLNYKNNVTENYNDQGTVAGFYLSSQNNEKGIQSAYRKDFNNMTTGIDIRTGYLTDIFYTQVVNCTDVFITSTYLQTIVGNIDGLNEANPAACFYIPYTHYYSVAVTPIESQK